MFYYDNKVHKALLSQAKFVCRNSNPFPGIVPLYEGIQDKDFTVSVLHKYSADCSNRFMNQRAHIDYDTSPVPLSVLWGDFLTEVIN